MLRSWLFWAFRAHAFLAEFEESEVSEGWVSRVSLPRLSFVIQLI